MNYSYSDYEKLIDNSFRYWLVSDASFWINDSHHIPSAQIKHQKVEAKEADAVDPMGIDHLGLLKTVYEENNLFIVVEDNSNIATRIVFIRDIRDDLIGLTYVELSQKFNKDVLGN